MNIFSRFINWLCPTEVYCRTDPDMKIKYKQETFNKVLQSCNGEGRVVYAAKCALKNGDYFNIKHDLQEFTKNQPEEVRNRILKAFEEESQKI